MFSKKSLFNEKTLLAVGVPGSQGGKNMLRMRFCLFLAFCLLLLPLSVAQAQVTEEWVARYNGPGNDSDIAYALAVDSWGNVYVTGESHGSGTGEDYSTVKYDSDGNELWVARYDGPGSGDDGARALAVDASGNVYVTGYSYGGGTEYDYA
ncbi:SBBP repeat-containing protein, partial [bacterium]|nr:SBBP repeat-containing protein [bacterium]